MEGWIHKLKISASPASERGVTVQSYPVAYLKKSMLSSGRRILGDDQTYARKPDTILCLRNGLAAVIKRRIDVEDVKHRRNGQE